MGRTRRRQAWLHWAAQCCGRCGRCGRLPADAASGAGDSGGGPVRARLAANTRVQCEGVAKMSSPQVPDGSVEEGLDALEEETRGIEEKTEQKIMNPVVPYSEKLQVSLKPGLAIIIHGKMNSKAMRFAVNLTCGASEAADIALHLNPRFQERVVVRNSKIRSHWGNEERAAIGKFPFIRDKKFNLQLLCTANEFMIAINGEHLCTYEYRVSLLKIHHIKISGDVTLNVLECKECQTYPLKYSCGGNSTLVLEKSVRLSNLLKENEIPVPLTFSLPCGLYEKGGIEIIGRVKLLPHLFYLNLQKGSQVWPNPDILLQVNIGFGDKTPTLACNSHLQEKWGMEEQSVVEQLKPGANFTLHISCEVDYYKIIVNGMPACTFNHRASAALIDSVSILGDILISDISIR